MGFMQSYKRLDNLCRDMNGIGVTGYIADMEQVRNGNVYVPDWWEQCRKLKYYRHIRNKIAHENYANEENMCSSEDLEWIENFYQKILTQTDPLAIYFKKKRSAKVEVHHGEEKILAPKVTSYERPSEINIPQNTGKGCMLCMVIALTIAAVLTSFIIYMI